MPDPLAGWPLAWPVSDPPRPIDPRQANPVRDEDSDVNEEPDVDETAVDVDRVGSPDTEEAR